MLMALKDAIIAVRSSASAPVGFKYGERRPAPFPSPSSYADPSRPLPGRPDPRARAGKAQFFSTFSREQKKLNYGAFYGKEWSI